MYGPVFVFVLLNSVLVLLQLKYKFSKQQEKPQTAEVLNTNHETLAELEKQVNDLHEEITLERQRNAELEKKLHNLTSTATRERKKCMSVIRLLADKVERLNTQLLHTKPNGHRTNGKNGMNGIKMAPDTETNPWLPMRLEGKTR